MDISQFDVYGMEPMLNGQFEKKTRAEGIYWQHTVNEIYAFPMDNGEFWALTTELGKQGAFLGLAYTGIDCPCDEPGAWTGFWDEVNQEWNGVKPRKNNEFLYTSVSLGPIDPTQTTTTPQTTTTLRK